MDNNNLGLINFYNAQSNLNRSTSQMLSNTKSSIEQKIQKLETAKTKLATQITSLENMIHNDFAKFSKGTDGFQGTLRDKFNTKCSTAKKTMNKHVQSHSKHKNSINSKIKSLQREADDLAHQISAANSLAEYYDSLSRRLL